MPELRNPAKDLREFAAESFSLYMLNSIQPENVELSNYLFWVRETLTRYQLAKDAPSISAMLAISALEKSIEVTRMEGE